MTEHKATLSSITTAIASLPEADKLAVSEAIRKLTHVINEYGDLGRLALAYVGASYAVDLGA